MSPARVSALVLAAGGARRMRGADKLAEPIAGESLLHRTARIAVESRAFETVVVLGARAESRGALLGDLPVKRVINPDWSRGMGTSLACGARAIDSRADAVMIVLADMPQLSARLLDTLIDAFPQGDPRVILRPVSADGQAGNPVVFGRAHVAALGGVEGDSGARGIIDAHRDFVRRLQVDDPGILLDLDTPEAWRQWRATRDG